MTTSLRYGSANLNCLAIIPPAISSISAKGSGQRSSMCLKYLSSIFRPVFKYSVTIWVSF